MKRHEIAVFANTLFKIGVREKKLKEFYDEFTDFVTLLQQSPDLNKFLQSPRVKKDEKRNFIHTLFENKFSKEIVAFILVILSKRCQSLYQKIYKNFQHLVDQKENIARGKVYSVQKLDEKQLKHISELLSKKFNKSIMLTSIIEEKLIGGVILEVDDVRIDMSVQHRLEEIKEQIMNTKIGGVAS